MWENAGLLRSDGQSWCTLDRLTDWMPDCRNKQKTAQSDPLATRADRQLGSIQVTVRLSGTVGLLGRSARLIQTHIVAIEFRYCYF